MPVASIVGTQPFLLQVVPLINGYLLNTDRLGTLESRSSALITRFVLALENKSKVQIIIYIYIIIYIQIDIPYLIHSASGFHHGRGRHHAKPKDPKVNLPGYSEIEFGFGEP